MSYRRSKEDKRRLKKLYDKTKNSCCAGVWYDEKKKRYIRFYSSNTPGYAKYLRRIANRKVRRAKISLKHSQYKRLYDYWWILY